MLGTPESPESPELRPSTAVGKCWETVEVPPPRRFVPWPEVDETLMAKEKLTSWSSGPFDCFQDATTCCWTRSGAADMSTFFWQICWPKEEKPSLLNLNVRLDSCQAKLIFHSSTFFQVFFCNLQMWTHSFIVQFLDVPGIGCKPFIPSSAVPTSPDDVPSKFGAPEFDGPEMWTWWVFCHFGLPSFCFCCSSSLR